MIRQATRTRERSVPAVMPRVDVVASEDGALTIAVDGTVREGLYGDRCIS